MYRAGISSGGEPTPLPAAPLLGGRCLALLLMAGSPAVHALGYLDYNAINGLEANSNLLLFPNNEEVALGVRFTTTPVLGYETATRAWSIAPSFQYQRFNDDFFGEQRFFNLAASGRYDWTQRLSTSLDATLQFDNNQRVNVGAPDPTIVLPQVVVERQSRQLQGTASYRWTPRFSTSLTGTYFDLLIGEVPGATGLEPGLDSKSINVGGSYFWNERLRFNGSAGLSQFKTFDGNLRNNDRFFNGGLTWSVSEKWTFSGSAGLRATEQTSRVFLPGAIVPGAIVSTAFPFGPELEGGVSPVLDALFGVPVIISGGVLRQRLIEIIPGFATQNIVSNTYDLQVSRIHSRGVLSFAMVRAVQPAGIQAQMDIESMTANASYRLDDRLNTTLAFMDTTQSFQGQQLGGGTFRNRDLSLGVIYQVSRRYSLSGGYSFREFASPVPGLRGASGHVLTVNLSFDGDRLVW